MGAVDESVGVVEVGADGVSGMDCDAITPDIASRAVSLQRMALAP